VLKVDAANDWPVKDFESCLELATEDERLANEAQAQIDQLHQR
jgi:hypothetical protein